MSDRAAPPWLGLRFDAAGRALPCPGLTVIGHLRDGPVGDALEAACATLRATAASACFAWLPRSSWHMTLYDGLLHDRRTPEFWPAGLAVDATPEAAEAFMAARLRLPPPGDAQFHMRPRAVETAPGGGLWVAMAARDAAEEARLRGWRDALAAAAGLTQRPGHATYAFHVTLAYAIAWPDAAAQGALEAALPAASAILRAAAPEIAVGPPEFCRFADMTRFDPIA